MKLLIAGNWKMNMTPAQAVALAEGIRAGMDRMPLAVDVLICPPFVDLSAVNSKIAGSAIKLGAQNMHPAEKGAFSGECSADMLKAVGCKYVICGHSERRHIFSESDTFINEKVIRAIETDLVPILCVGEKLDERQNGLTFNVVERQLRVGLLGVSDHQIRQVVIAYEPVWAIGTGLTATPTQAQEVHAFIRDLLDTLYPDAAKDVRILYGGSVKPENIDALIREPDINGALVGGASLKIDSFLDLIRAGNRIKKA